MGRYGSGTVFQRGKIWYYQCYVNGEQIGPKSSGSTEKADAERELDKLLGQRARGDLVVSPKGYRISHVLEAYLRHVERHREENTRREYASHINRHLIPFFGNTRPDRLTTAHLEKYRDQRKADPRMRYSSGSKSIVEVPDKHITETTINRELAVLRAALNHAVKTKQGDFQIPFFPISREKNVRKGFLNEERFEQQFWQLPYWGVRALTASSFYTGVRKGELRKIDWPQVDFRNGVITVFDAKNHETREIPILAGLMRTALEEAKKERDELWPECEAVFIYEGKRLGDPKRSWRTSARAIEEEPVRIHDLRRSGNRYMRDIGVPQGIRMKIMGHKTPSQDKRYGIVDRTDIDIVKELHAKKQKAKKKPGKGKQRQ